LGAQSAVIPTQVAVEELAFNKEGSLLLTGYADGHIGLWDMTKGIADVREIHSSPTDFTSAPSMASYGCGGGWVIAGQVAKNDKTAATIYISNAAGEPATPLPSKHEFGVLSVAVSPDCKTIISGGMDGLVVLWTVQSGTWKSNDIANYKGSYVHGVAFSSDGKHAAWAEDGGTVSLYEVATGKTTHLSGDFDRAYSVAFSPDGRLLVGGGRLAGAVPLEGTALIWKIPSGEKIGLPKRFLDDGPHTVAFDRDGQLLVSAVSRGQAVIWEVNPISLRERACRLAHLT
jgi:WD40 repeat protein